MSVDRSVVAERLRDFMVDGLLWQVPRQSLTEDYSLLENDLLDSLDMLRLVSFLEEEFGLRFADDDFVPENFETIGGMVQLVEQRRGA
jgi:acyl carrier protein